MPLYGLDDYCRRCGVLDMGHVHARYYCPSCHEVTCGMKRHGAYIALPHYRKEVGAKVAQKLCRGGPVDPKGDRAP